MDPSIQDTLVYDADEAAEAFTSTLREPLPPSAKQSHWAPAAIQAIERSRALPNSSSEETLELPGKMVSREERVAVTAAGPDPSPGPWKWMTRSCRS